MKSEYWHWALIKMGGFTVRIDEIEPKPLSQIYVVKISDYGYHRRAVTAVNATVYDRLQITR
jgi:hypothetical protein